MQQRTLLLLQEEERKKLACLLWLCSAYDVYGALYKLSLPRSLAHDQSLSFSASEVVRRHRCGSSFTTKEHESCLERGSRARTLFVYSSRFFLRCIRKVKTLPTQCTVVKKSERKENHWRRQNRHTHTQEEGRLTEKCEQPSYVTGNAIELTCFLLTVHWRSHPLLWITNRTCVIHRYFSSDLSFCSHLVAYL